MACLNGSQPQEGKSGIATLDLVPFINPITKLLLEAANFPTVIEFEVEFDCAQPPPEIAEYSILDFGNVPSLYAKIVQNYKREMWFQNCQCSPLIPPDPPQEPLPPPPDSVPEGTADMPPAPTPLCDLDDRYTRWVLIRGYTGTLLDSPASAALRYGDSRNPINFSFQPKPEYGNQIWIVPEGGGGSPLSAALFGAGGGNFLILDASIYDCYNPLPEFSSGIPSIPNIPINPDDLFPPDEGGGGDCLKLPDRAFIISELQAWTSESNNRIRDEIVDAISAKTSLDKGDIAQYITDAKDFTNENIDFTKSIIESRYEALRALIEALEPYIDGAKNQILAGIGALAASITAALAALLTAITAAITASTTAITTAITATQTTLSNLINSVKGDIERKVETEGEKNNYKRLVVRVSIQSFPTNTSVTNGRDGSPDRVAFGWLIFYRTMPNGTKFYFERRFINFVRCSFISEGSAENIGYVIHFFPSVVGLAESEVIRFKDNG